MAGKGAPKGNNNAGKNKPWSDALRKALLQSDGARLRRIAEALLKKAEEGDIAALKELGDRVEGRVIQQIEQSGKDGAPLMPTTVIVCGPDD